MDDIKHYGVLGMRWGRRRAGGNHTVSVGKGVRGALKEVGGLAKDALTDDLNRTKALVSKIRAKAAPHPDSARAASLKKKPLSKLSNDELKVAINRMQLEKQFRDLNPAAIGKGKGILTKMLANLAAKTVNSYVAGVNSDPSYEFFAQAVREKAGNKKG